MKFIKNIWQKNPIVFVLVCVLIICFIAIVTVASTFFLSGRESSYGERLNNINEYEVTQEFITTYKDSVTENKLVDNVEFRVSGRIIYIIIVFNADTILDEAKSVATKSLDVFSEKILGYYDIDFTIKQNSEEEGFILMGARNVNGTGVIWNNNTKVEESDK